VHRRDRLSFLALDAEELERCAEAPAGAEPGAAEAARLWLAIGRGAAPTDAEARAKVLYREAAAAKQVLLSVEATSLQAMAALGAGDVEGALAAARRASRMARTEALPEAELLANLVLARVRRHTGKPHLASRILAALARLAPPPWHALIAWEALLSGGLEAGAALAGATRGAGSRSAAAAGALADALAAAQAGARAAFEDAGGRALAAVEGWDALTIEADALLAALDAARPAPAVLLPWARGAEPLAPLGLQGASPAAPEEAIAFVVVRPGAPGRRILRAGLALAAPDAISPHALAGSPREHYRTDTALAVLAGAGPAGLTRDELFGLVYGLPYAQRLHEGAFRVLVHRMRKRVEGLAEVAREADRLCLAPARPLIVPDPRCAQPTEAAVLRLLAARGAVGSDEIASELRLSVRATQSALKQLVEDGALQVERQGRHVQYRVDDTTFSEPTPYATRPGG
jgi:DNA-binding transcriptional ArsR family regulator